MAQKIGIEGRGPKRHRKGAESAQDTDEKEALRAGEFWHLLISFKLQSFAVGAAGAP
jgi:hypothetical protein